MTLEKLTQIYKALSDPTRAKVIYLLLQKESLCVCEIMSVLQLKQSTASRHLAYLKNSGLVKSWRKGTWIHYAIIPEALAPINTSEILKTLKQEIELQENQVSCAGVN